MLNRIKSEKGFTLFEMLAIIAIIAILVAVALPLANKAHLRAQAATDAANLRNVLGVADTKVYLEGKASALEDLEYRGVTSSFYPGAELYVVWYEPGFVDAYFVQDGKYYGLQYFCDMAVSLESSESTAKRSFDGEVVWYNATTGEAVDGS